MAEYRLHCMKESGNCYKAALMLQLCGCDWEPVGIDYFNGATREAAFRDEFNEMGEIPVLDHGERRLSQSGVILTYLAGITGKFAGRNEDEKLEILRWMLFDNHKFTSYYATLRFLFGLQKCGETPVTEFLRGRALGAWTVVEKHLASRPFLVGEIPTIADLSLAGYVYYTDETGIDRAAFPNINAWAGRIAALPGWQHPYSLMSTAS
ncbi:glutathione S-transferase family protein [Dongia soli]|uniref:Glutathione S-transferase n=1 Tax=Dongia soli TaxID=600628 RepID=A0ABU5E8Z8_9PROT|nr:glutathione S-transferase [Dongia soli]MDY0882249.1 glutathione S-transferase [Dongia soli]